MKDIFIRSDLYLLFSSVLGLYTGTCFASSIPSPLMMSAALSATMIVGAFKFPLTYKLDGKDNLPSAISSFSLQARWCRWRAL